MKKLILLSFSLIAMLLLLNTTNAAVDRDSNVKLEIRTGASYCTIVSDLDLSFKEFSYEMLVFTGDFATTNDLVDPNGTDWVCEDKEGLTSWTVDVQSTSVINMTDDALNTLWTIPATGVSIYSVQAEKEAGECTVDLLTTAGDSLETAKSILGKTSAQYEVCRIGVHTPVTLDVSTAPSQPIGIYSGTLTITSPF